MLSINKKSLSIPLLIATIAFVFTNCDSTTGSGELESQIEIHTAKDVPANADAGRGAPPDFTFYNLENHEIISDSDSVSNAWDIAFSGTTILVNGGVSGPGEGGAVVLDQAFDATDQAPSSGYEVDTDTSHAITDWYNYTGDSEPAHAVLPIENTTIVLKTGDGDHYAKFRIISYYKGNPDTSTDEFANMETRPPSRYYTFEYAIQLNETRELN